MSRFGQYGGNFYDPVGSHANQPTGYTWGSSAANYPSSTATSGYGTTYSNYNGNAYGNQQYDGSSQQQQSQQQQKKSNAELMAQNNHNPNLFRVDNSASGYAGSNARQQTQMQHNTSPLDSNRQPHLSAMGGTQSGFPSHGGSNTLSNPLQFRDNRSNVQGGHSQQKQPQQPPQRYQSPLHALQASQHGHQRQSSRRASQQPSPRMSGASHSTQQIYQQPSNTPSNVTVNPSHVYDNRAELHRQAQLEAERRRQREAEQAAKKAEEDRVAAAEAEKQRLEAEKQRVEEERRKAEEAEEKAHEEAVAKKKEQNRLKNEQRRKAREEKKRSNTAATALQQLSSSSFDTAASNAASGAPETEEEQMRALFKRMREFNAKNPAMLAKLWEEERTTHSQAQEEAPAPTPKPAAGPSAKSKKMTAAEKSASASKKKAADVSTPVPPAGRPSDTPQPASAISQPPKPPVRGDSSTPLPQPSKLSVGTSNTGGQPQATANRQIPGTSVWPNHSKGLIAEAARKWLKAQPLNYGMSITKETLLSMLNSGPSYVQLCGMLEGQGWKFDRTKFARELLKAAPDLSKLGGPKGTALDTVNSPNTAATNANGLSNASPPGASATMNPGQALGSAQAYANAAPDALASREPVGNDGQLPSAHEPATQPASYESQAPDVKPSIVTYETPRPPADKEEAARKRAFGDLVDLTAEDESDDETPPPAKFFKPSISNGGVGGDLSQPQSQPQPPLDPRSLWQPMAYNQFMRRAPGQVPPPGPHTLPSTPTLDNNMDAKQQQQHPPPPPKPAPPVQKPKGPTQEQLQYSRMRGRMLVEPIMRDRVARRSTYDSRTIARDVLLATGRHPDMRSLNSHLAPMQKLLGDHGGQVDHEGRQNLKCDLATIKWDVIDPGKPREAGDIEASKNGDTGTADTKVERGTPDDARDAILQQRAKPSTADRVLSGEHGQAEASPKPRKKIGRPRKSDYTLTNQHLGDDAGSRPPTPDQRDVDRRQSAPHSASAAAQPPPPDMSGPVGYAAFAQKDATGAKKKGRPFGWRKNIHSREAQGLPPSKPAQTTSKPRESASSVTAAEVEPNYPVFKCGWTDCTAKLHNLETLKKHVVKMHGKASDDKNLFECHWRSCNGEQFYPIERWLEHVDVRHLQPIAWKLGDGPKGGSLSDAVHEPGTYLSDARGRSVTPIISPVPPRDPDDQHQQQQHPAAGSNHIQWPKRVGRPSSNPTDRTPVECLQDLEKHKRAVGPVLDRQGCVLASEERRRCFLEDEDFEDEVYGSEFEDD